MSHDPAASDAPSDEPLTRADMLAAIPPAVIIWEDVNLDAADPALIGDGLDAGRRICIAARRAGGRCTVNACHDGLLCPAHSGRLDPSIGGKAKGRRNAEARERAEQEAAVRRLGTRAVIAATISRNHELLIRSLETLMALAADGDRAAALALIPYLNQGLGMPGEKVEVLGAPSTSDEVAGMATSDLIALVRARRPLAAVADDTGRAASEGDPSPPA